MKAVKREPYLILTGVKRGISLCCFCRYAEWEGDCGERYPVCHHPLDAISDNESLYVDVQLGSDCWGFRPDVAPEVAVDIVGIWLQGKFVVSDSIPKIGVRR